jgi:hypothetical protein
MDHSKGLRTIHLASMALAVVSTFCAWGQQNSATARVQHAECLKFIRPLSNVAARYRAVRAIEDRGTHQHWLVLEDLSRPTAPALFVQAPGDLSCVPPRPTEAGSRLTLPVPEFSLPAIRAGDPIVLFEHTPISDAELEATALKAAAVGQPLTVRLKFGGHIVHAIANAPGRATVSAEASEGLR